MNMNTERDCCLDALILLHVLDLKIGKLKTCRFKAKINISTKNGRELEIDKDLELFAYAWNRQSDSKFDSIDYE